MTDRQKKLLAEYYSPKVEAESPELEENTADETTSDPDEGTENKAVVKRPAKRKAKRTQPKKTS